MMRIGIRVLLGGSLALLGAAGLGAAADPAAPSQYEQHRAAAVRTCEAIDPARYQSGLLFNPDGYRSFYVQSECLQEAAVRFRDEALCARVRRRLALFWSSWGYSPANCRALVSEGAARDRTMLQTLRRAYDASHVVLRDFRIDLNNNGRDFELVPIVDGDAGHGYELRVEVTRPGSGPAVLHSNGYWMTAASPLRVYLTRAEVQRLLPDLSPVTRYTITASMTFSVPTGDGNAEWSDAFIEDVFPRAARTQALAKTTSFPGEQRR